MRFSCFLVVAVFLFAVPCVAQDQQASTEKDSLLFPVEMTDYTLSVKDEKGDPIEGVEVVANGVRCEEDRGSWYAWPIPNAGNDNKRITDTTGKVTFRYPVKYGVPPDLKTLNKIDFTFSHPEFVTSRQETDPRGDAIVHKMVAGCPVLFSAVNANGEPIESFWVQMAGPGSAAKWILADQTIRTGSIPDGAWQTMLVAPQIDGPTLFSGILPTRFRKNSKVTIRGIELKPGLRIGGRLDDGVPRPVANGRVVAWQLPKPRGRCHGEDDPSLGWSDVTEMNEDGSFEFESMPRTGVVQFIAICSGWIVKSEHRNGRPAGGRVLGVLVNLDDMQVDEGLISDIIIPMEKAGDLEVTVRKPDGTPLVGAEVATWPNQVLEKSGSQLLGACYPTLEQINRLIAGKEWDYMEAFRSQKSRYMQITDENGRCVLRDLPIDRDLAMYVQHEDFQSKSTGVKNEEREVKFRVTEEEPTKSIEVEVEPIPK